MLIIALTFTFNITAAEREYLLYVTLLRNPSNNSNRVFPDLRRIIYCYQVIYRFNDDDSEIFKIILNHPLSGD